MELDKDKIDDAVLGLLYLGLHDGARAWKGFDWDAMNRLQKRLHLRPTKQGQIRRFHGGGA